MNDNEIKQLADTALQKVIEQQKAYSSETTSTSSIHSTQTLETITTDHSFVNLEIDGPALVTYDPPQSQHSTSSVSSPDPTPLQSIEQAHETDPNPNPQAFDNHSTVVTDNQHSTADTFSSEPTLSQPSEQTQTTNPYPQPFDDSNITTEEEIPDTQLYQCENDTTLTTAFIALYLASSLANNPMITENEIEQEPIDESNHLVNQIPKKRRKTREFTKEFKERVRQDHDIFDDETMTIIQNNGHNLPCTIFKDKDYKSVVSYTRNWLSEHFKSDLLTEKNNKIGRQRQGKFLFTIQFS